MGMAASQARFLGLTARKTNTEYEGQQVNQQRTALSNESASLYNRLVNLSVPTPPDTYDFYKDTYSFDYNNNEYTLKQISPTSTENIYNVTAKYTQTTSVATYKQLAQVTYTTPTDTENGSINVSGVSYDLAKAVETEEEALRNNWNAKHADEPLPDGTKFYSYTNSSGVVNYIPTTQLPPTTTPVTVDQVDDYYYTTESQTKYAQFNNVKMLKDEDGKYYNITITDASTGKETTCTTTQTRQMDDEAYSKAMTNYTIAKDAYDKQISDINAKTEAIQQQDKTLELRLKQLDTEQSALQTELDAVSKVIEKNVESTFKTFA